MGLKSNEEKWSSYEARHQQQKREVEENTKQNNRIIKMWEHDGWGDSIHFLSFDKREITGHLTPLPKVGDEVQCIMVSKKVLRCKVVSLEYCGDPADMFFGTVEDIGFMEE